MQTFLPYTSFIESAKCLDYRRLGKQRVESKQILDILLGQAKTAAWAHHPAVLMWKGYEDTLKLYHDIIIEEWKNRGYKNNMKQFCGQLSSTLLTIDYLNLGTFKIPHWLTDEFCSRHRSALLAKNYDYYKKFNWTEEPKYEYLWPSSKEK